VRVRVRARVRVRVKDKVQGSTGGVCQQHGITKEVEGYL
jgi:hypothetical protein